MTLIESQVADRLESHLSFLKKEDFSFKTLEALIGGIKGFKDSAEVPADSELRSMMGELRAWPSKRNMFMHEMAKLATDEQMSWAEKYEEARAVEVDGIALFRKIDRRMHALRSAAK